MALFKPPFPSFLHVCSLTGSGADSGGGGVAAVTPSMGIYKPLLDGRGSGDREGTCHQNFFERGGGHR